MAGQSRLTFVQNVMESVYIFSVNATFFCLCLKGPFPDGDTAEDGYHGTAPVTAYPPQNNYGMLRDFVFDTHICATLYIKKNLT